ncbi:MAG: mycothiol synthase, partial [Frankiaceae bacterium]|nr:mycothiol synthase [Frankiaceae bacterium]
MPPVTRRPTVDDAEAICALMAACDVAVIGHPDTTLADVRDRLSGPDLDLERDAWLVTDAGGRAAGYAVCENQGQSDLFWLDAYSAGGSDDTLSALWDLAEARAAEVARSLGHAQ